MLGGDLGVRLTLLIGRTVPIPAPMSLLAALASVQVHCDSQNGDGFTLTFSITKENPVDYTLMQGGLLDAPSRVILAVSLGIVPEVLIDGAITHHQLDPGGGDGKATLTVMGKSISVMMDLEERDKQYPNQSDSIIVTQLIGGYAKYGLIPSVTTTTNVPLQTGRIPNQKGTDLQYIQQLAKNNGFVFYIEPVTIGVNNAYWGPEKRAGVPLSALTVNMGAADNVSRLSFANDALSPIGTSATVIEPISKTAIPVSSLPSLKLPPLSGSPAQPLRKTLQRDTAKKKPGDAATSVIASVTGAPDAVTASGEVDALRYGAVLRARRIVGVRGVGLSYNGNYYITSVTHTIAPGSYKQAFTLSREGTGSLLPVVKP